MDYSDFSEQVRRELEESSAGVWADESILAWTNEAVLDIAKRAEATEDHVYTLSVIGQQTYDLPDNTLEVKKFAYNDVVLERIPIQQWGELTQSGTPNRWDIVNRAVYLYPIPTVAATIDIFRRTAPTAIASVTATTDMPYESRHNALIKNYVKAQAMSQISDLNSFTALIQAYEAGIANTWVQERQEEAALISTGSPLEVW